MALLTETLTATSNRKEALTDLAWALFNTTELLCRH
jgi:hypothetical protein